MDQQQLQQQRAMYQAGQGQSQGTQQQTHANMRFGAHAVGTLESLGQAVSSQGQHLQDY